MSKVWVVIYTFKTAATPDCKVFSLASRAIQFVDNLHKYNGNSDQQYYVDPATISVNVRVID